MAFGFDIGREWKGLDLETGLQYSEKGQQLSEQVRFQIHSLIPYIDQWGDTTYIPWDYRDTTVVRKNSDPTYRYASIPFAIGKTFDVSPKYGLELGFNGRFNILLNAQGSGISPSLSLTEIKTSQFDRLNLSLGGYAGVKRELSDYVSIALRLNWNGDVNNMFRDNNQKQRFTNYGIGVSVRHKLY